MSFSVLPFTGTAVESTGKTPKSAREQDTTTTTTTTTTTITTTTTTTTKKTTGSAAETDRNLRGDCNCSKIVDVSDAVLLARFVAEDPEAMISKQGRANADCNRDSNLNGDDVIIILRIIAKLD